MDANATNTYTIYKVFDAVYSAAGISYKLVDGKTTAPAGFSVDSAGNVTYSGSGTNGQLTDADIAAIRAYVTDADKVGTIVTTGSTANTSTDVGTGYFFIDTTTGTVVTIDSTNPDATVEDKNTVPGVDKKITGASSVDDNGKKALAQVGTVVNYSAEITIGKGAKGYIFHDTMETGLKYNNDAAVTGVAATTGEGVNAVTKRDGKLVINEVQAGVVRRIFRDYLDGYSMDMIGNDLRREGVPSGAGRTDWPVSSVKYILQNEKYAGDLLLQKFLVEDFLTHKVIRNKGQLPQYFVSQAHAPIVPRAVFDRAKEEKYLRGINAGKGGTHFGSRKALKGRTFCSCGAVMVLRRRQVNVYRCLTCGVEVTESALRSQVMDAIRNLPAHRNEIESKIDALASDLASKDRRTRAVALRTEWRLRNLLPDHGMMEYCPACYDEEDFRARTNTKRTEWSDAAVVRVLVKVVAGVEVEFNGGIRSPCQAHNNCV